MADEAAVVGVARGFWRAACSRCDWTYGGISREVDMAARGHCYGCGGDVVAIVVGDSRETSPVVLRLERDVTGRVVRGSEPEPEPTEPLAHVPRNRVYWESQ